jgi:hypothetical protein
MLFLKCQLFRCIRTQMWAGINYLFMNKLAPKNISKVTKFGPMYRNVQIIEFQYNTSKSNTIATKFIK